MRVRGLLPFEDARAADFRLVLCGCVQGATADRGFLYSSDAGGELMVQNVAQMGCAIAAGAGLLGLSQEPFCFLGTRVTGRS